MRYRYVIFDVDGTLIDSSEAIERGMSDVADAVLGRDLTPQERAAASGLPAGRALEAVGIPATDENVRLWLDGIIARADSIRLFDGVVPLLDHLCRLGATLALVTADTRYEFEHVFARFGLAGLFDAVVCSDDTERHKPDPEPLLACLGRLGARPDEALYVGDGPGDARAAAAAGMDFALACWGPGARCEGGGGRALARCDDPADVARLVSGG